MPEGLSISPLKRYQRRIAVQWLVFLDDLFIDPVHRGSGTAQTMYQALVDFGKAQGWPFFRWITADNNYQGRGLYDNISDKTHWVMYQMATD